MISQISTIRSECKEVRVKRQNRRGIGFFYFLLYTFTFCIPAAAQRVAVLSPDGGDASRDFAGMLEVKLAEQFRIVDDEMSGPAFSSTGADDKFNMTLEESKASGAAIGCDFLILVRSETLRRSSSKRSQYYESYAAVYGISARTGRLVFWLLPRFEAATAQGSRSLLNEAVVSLASELVSKLKTTVTSELAEPPPAQIEEPPASGSPQAKAFRAPIPYRRIKPEYTADAFLYAITATVDIVVDLDQRGSIQRTEIVRWAGYGLDESVDKAVRSMNWRPAERHGKALPLRFLLRYNFKKLDKN